MRIIATTELLAFIVVAFGLRSFMQWRATGHTGFVGLRPGAGVLERAAGLVMVLAIGVGPFAPWIGEPVFAGVEAAGAALAFLGIALTFGAQLQMGKSWRIGVDASERTELVTRGPFAMVRNPIFSAMLLVSFGLALAVPTPLALALPPCLLAALELQVRVVEEPYLIRTHGARYLDWAARTGRFVPWLGRLERPRIEPG